MKNLLLVSILCMFSLQAFAFTVLLDPGHGGEELGAVAKVWRNIGRTKRTVNLYEKDLTLSLAKKIKAKLEKKHTVYLTRSIDRTVTLEERAQMAEAVKADLFISIHFNSSVEPHSHGFETYFLDNHHDAAVKKVELAENGGFSSEDEIVNQILIDLVIEKTVNNSKKLAGLIHERVKKNVSEQFHIRDRGIRPGLFYVLALSKRPGVLIEAGFLSNPKEVRTLNNQQFLDKYAQSVSTGIEKYFSSLPPKDLSLF